MNEKLMNLGLTLKRIRKLRGWGVMNAANRAGIMPAMVYKIENHTSNYRIDTLLRYAEALEVDVLNEDMLLDCIE